MLLRFLEKQESLDKMNIDGYILYRLVSINKGRLSMPKIGMEPIRRAQVIRAVIESIAEQGLEALTMDAVAKKADVSKGVVNYYFAGKRDMLLQSFHAFLESYNQKIADSIQPDMSAMEMMGIVIDVCFPAGDVALPLWKHDPKIPGDARPQDGPDPTYSIDQLGKVFVHFLTKTILDSDFQAVYQKVYNTYLEGMKTIIQDGIAAGEFRAVDPDEAAYSLMALIEGMVMYRNIGFRPLSPQHYRTVCKDIARRYLITSQPYKDD
jgi:TetR/AcrR family transcriptional repressor of bet genes